MSVGVMEVYILYSVGCSSFTGSLFRDFYVLHANSCVLFSPFVSVPF